MDIGSTLEEFRQIYLKHGAVTNVDYHFNEAIGKHVVEHTIGFADPQDEMNFKTVSTATFDPVKGSVELLNSTGSEDLTLLLQRYSPTGKYKVFLKASKAGMVIEVTDKKGPVLRHVVPMTTHQGFIRKSTAFVSDGVVWNAEETRFMYMADDPKPLLNLFKLKELGLGRYKYEDIPGERIQGHTNPSIFVFDIPSKTLFRVAKPRESPQSRVIYAMPQFVDPAGTAIVCVSFNMVEVFEIAFFTNYPKKLELLSGLAVDKVKTDFLKNNYVLPQQFKFERPGLEEAIVYFPRISPDFKQCIYLYAKESRHSSNNTFGLRHFLLADPNNTTTLTEPVRVDTGDFNGLSGFSFILNSWSWLGNDRVVCSTWTHQTTKLYEVTIADKTVKGISRPRYLPSESHHVIGALDDRTLLVRRDTLYRSNLFFLLQRDPSGAYTEHLLHHPLDEGYTIEEEEVVVGGIEAAFFGIKDETVPKETRPCILYVHGGPHVVWNNGFHHLFRYLMGKQYTVLNINYTGSAGRGEEFSERVFGKLELLPQEIVNVCEKLAADKKIDIKQVKFFSGSTGGKIGLWFLHTHPTFLESMSIYNPPCDGNTLQYESVFPGLAPGTFLGDNSVPFGPKHHFDDENTLKLQHQSVFNRTFNFSTKVLLFGGLKDSVVHRSSNRRLYKTARAHGLKMDFFEYPEEEHVIITPNASFDFYFKTSLLFLGKWKFS